MSNKTRCVNVVKKQMFVIFILFKNLKSSLNSKKFHDLFSCRSLTEGLIKGNQNLANSLSGILLLYYNCTTHKIGTSLLWWAHLQQTLTGK